MLGVLEMVCKAGKEVEPTGRYDAHAALKAEFHESMVGKLELFSRSDVVSEWDEVIQLQGIDKWGAVPRCPAATVEAEG